MEEVGGLRLQLQELRQGKPRKAHDEGGVQILAGETMTIDPDSDVTQTEAALLNLGLYFETIKLGMEVVMEISEMHVFTDSAKASFDLAETHVSIMNVTIMGAELTKKAAKDAGFKDYEKILRGHIKNLEKKAKEEK